jgi:hypothetical protein
MLKSYEAAIENGQIRWLNEQPWCFVANHPRLKVRANVVKST